MFAEHSKAPTLTYDHEAPAVRHSSRRLDSVSQNSLPQKTPGDQV